MTAFQGPPGLTPVLPGLWLVAELLLGGSFRMQVNTIMKQHERRRFYNFCGSSKIAANGSTDSAFSQRALSGEPTRSLDVLLLRSIDRVSNNRGHGLIVARCDQQSLDHSEHTTKEDRIPDHWGRISLTAYSNGRYWARLIREDKRT